MPALPARRIALGALCAAFLAGITGPTAMAVDSAPEHHRATSSDALLVQVRNLDAHEDDLAPVADLLEAVLEADAGQLPAAEAGELGEAAKDALEEAAAQTPAATATPTAPAPATDTLLPGTEADPMSDALDAVREAVDSLVDALLSDQAEDADQISSSVDDLLTEVEDLVDELTGGEPQMSILPAPAQGPVLPVVTLPALTSPASVLLPAS
ncbi:hypothetical protein ABZS79_32200 [Streptomyces griseoloalbus]|uniref:hypothetical protein n=1 Tax=Streptomyces griseoloalbus TaxID=67303 RepID=UPI0033B124AB